MTSQNTDLPLCACGCGEPVATPGAKWKRGHFRRGEHLAPLPGPDDEIDLMGEIDLGEPPELPGQEASGLTWFEGSWPPSDEIPPDAPPADLKDTKPGPARKAQKVTAGLRKDISAKISFGLEIPGQVWAARDPWCGGTFVAQRPAIADALTDIVCDSPDLVDWFTGPAGGFMKWFKLAAALQPVAVTVYAHHVAHSIGGEEQEQAPQQDMSRYAA